MKQKATAFYDGKFGRGCSGEIVRRLPFDLGIQVEFKPWAGDVEKARVWFWRHHKKWRKRELWYWGGYHKYRGSLMRRLVGTPGDYYNIRRCEYCGQFYHQDEQRLATCCPSAKIFDMKTWGIK